MGTAGYNLQGGRRKGKSRGDPRVIVVSLTYSRNCQVATRVTSIAVTDSSRSPNS